MGVSVDTVRSDIAAVGSGIDLLLGIVGFSELDPIVTDIQNLLNKLIAAKNSQNPTLAVEVAGADAAGDASIETKFPPMPGTSK